MGVTDPGPIPDRDPREDKLPQWARTQMDRLRNLTGQWQAFAEQARRDLPVSPVCLHYYSDLPVYLPSRETIFMTDPHAKDRTGRQEALLSVSFRPDRAHLIVSSLNGEPIIASPQASNAVKLLAAPRSLRSVW